MADARPGATDHARHDRELISRVAAGDGAPGDIRAAAILVDGCRECRSIDADLRLIAASARDLKLASLVAAPRDFRITARDAERLRPTGLRRLTAAVRGGAAAAVPRRIGGGLVAIGFVGILLGSGITAGLPGFGLGGAAAPTRPADALGAAVNSGSTAAPESTMPPAAGDLKASTSPGAVFAPVQTASPARTSPPPLTNQSRGGAGATSRDTISPRTGGVVVGASVALVVLGLVLLLSGRQGRRSGP